MPLAIAIKAMIDAICGALNAAGGYHWLFCRRFIMPAVIAVSVSFLSGVWWLGACCLPTMGTLCLGYGKIGNWFRGIWMAIQAVALSLGTASLGHLSWWIFGPYVVGALVLGWIYISWEQLLGDFIAGFYLSSFIWFIH